MNPVSNYDLNPLGVKTPHGKTFPEYVNPSNIPVTYVSLDNPYMKEAYTYAKELYTTEGLTDKVKKMTITSSVIVKNRKVISKGANGDGWHQKHNTCVRMEKNLPTGVGYEECPGCCAANHAEQTALRVAGAAAQGAEIYLYGHWWICASCWNAITTAGITHIYLLENADALFDRNEKTTVIGTPQQYNTETTSITSTSKKGKIIVIEGSDGTGKETQTNLLIENLKKLGHSVTSLAFPRYSSETLGGRLLYHTIKSDRANEYMLSTINPYSASLLYVMDRVESIPYIQDLLQEFDYIVMDRYYTANLLHQGAKFDDEAERNKFLDTMYGIEVKQLHIPKADVVIYLTLPFEVSLARMEKRRRETGEAIDQTERDHTYIKNSTERGLGIAKHLDWSIIQGVEQDDAGNITKEYTKEERQEQILQTLRDTHII